MANEFENPPNRQKIRESLMAAGFIFVIGLVMSAWTGIWASMAIIFLLAGIMLLPLYWQQYIKRPNLVRIIGGGLELQFRRKGTIFIDWNDIMALRAPIDDPSMAIKQSIAEGVLAVKGKGLYLVRPTIAIAARRAYREETGRDLPGLPSDTSSAGHELV